MTSIKRFGAQARAAMARLPASLLSHTTLILVVAASVHAFLGVNRVDTALLRPNTATIVVAADVATSPHMFLAALRAIGLQALPSAIEHIEVVVADTGLASSQRLVPHAASDDSLHFHSASEAPAGSLPEHVTVRYAHLPHSSIMDALQHVIPTVSGAYVVFWDMYSLHSADRLMQQLTPLIQDSVRACCPVFTMFIYCSIH